MQDTINKPPIIDTPNLPPTVKGSGEPRRKVFIMPSLLHAGDDVTTRTYERDLNFITIHHVWMMKVQESFQIVGTTHVNTRLYRQWLEAHPESFTDGVPPHIQFGGGIKIIPGGDPTFYKRWTAYARKTFVC